jgi:hypothetical protein
MTLAATPIPSRSGPASIHGSDTRQFSQCAHQFFAPAQVTQRQFDDNEGMGQHIDLLQQFGQPGVAVPQVIYPY